MEKKIRIGSWEKVDGVRGGKEESRGEKCSVKRAKELVNQFFEIKVERWGQRQFG